ncbi:MAG: energy transducer TonB [Ferruginibacter sp.]
MKKILLPLLLLAGFFTNAQTIQKYYNWKWEICEPGLARFLGIIKLTDSGWLRSDYYLSTKKLQMRGLYQDSACKSRNGFFTYYYSNGNISSKGKYINNNRDGIWLSFHNNGMMQDSSVYEMGNLTGTSLAWFSNGYIADSCVYNKEGYGIRIYWFDDGTPSVAGRSLNNKKQGKWQYFHKNGKLASLEEYEQGKLLNKTYYDESGKQLADTTDHDRGTEFKGGPEKWQKYLLKNLVWPAHVKLVNTDIVTVVVVALVDEDGNIKEAYVDIPFAAEFDNEALRVIKRSPKWEPAISHNRRLQMYIRQSISFSQQEE